jgi:hypothetical protein
MLNKNINELISGLQIWMLSMCISLEAGRYPRQEKVSRWFE